MKKVVEIINKKDEKYNTTMILESSSIKGLKKILKNMDMDLKINMRETLNLYKGGNSCCASKSKSKQRQ